MNGAGILEAISGTGTFLSEGDAYLKVVVNAHKRPQIFSLEMQFNLLTMAIEKHVMAILTSAGMLPNNHAFLDLLDGLKWVIPVSEEVDQQLRSLDHHESMCSLEMSGRHIPDAKGMRSFIALGCRVQQAAHEMASGTCVQSLALE